MLMSYRCFGYRYKILQAQLKYSWHWDTNKSRVPYDWNICSETVIYFILPTKVDAADPSAPSIVVPATAPASTNVCKKRKHEQLELLVSIDVAQCQRPPHKFRPKF